MADKMMPRSIELQTNFEIIGVIVHYPIYLSKTLMQLGYEPMPAVNGRLPAIYSYLKYIKNKRGLDAWYIGLPHHLCFVLANDFVRSPLSDMLTKAGMPKKEVIDTNTFVYDVMRDTIIVIQKTIITYPLSSITVLYIISKYFDNEEPVVTSSNVFQLLGRLYRGILPKLIVDVALCWASKCGSYGARFLDDSIAKLATSATPGFLVGTLLYPLNVMSTVMKDGGRSRLNPELATWQECWGYLSATNSLRRGASLVWRRAPMPIKPIRTYY